MTSGVIGYFQDPDAVQRAARQLRLDTNLPVDAYLPIPDQPTLDILFPRSSPVRWVGLAGGLFGITAALTMTIWMSWDYPLVVGGKPITSIPPFMVAAFELMVLFGSIFSVAGFLFFARLPDLTPTDAYRQALGVDAHALYIPCESESQVDSAERALRSAGAIQLERVAQTERTRLQETP